MPLIYFFRQRTDNDPYEGTFRESGWETDSIPVLDIQWIAENRLRMDLEAPEKYGGLIVTSPRAALAIGELLPLSSKATDGWKRLPVYVVGPKTRELIEHLGFRTRGSDSGSASVLAGVIAGDSASNPLLFVCGDKRRDELPRALSRAQISLVEREVYRTRIVNDLNLRERAIPDWVVFFSPSGVYAVQKSWPDTWLDVSKAAIGSTTAQAVEEAGWPVHAVATEPSPQGILEAVVSPR